MIFKWLFDESFVLILFPTETLTSYFVQKWPPGCSIKKAVLKNFAIFTGKHLCWSLFLIKVKAFSTPISKSICEGLLLVILPLHHHIEVATILLYSIGDFWRPLATLGSWKTLNYRQKQPSRGVLRKSVLKKCSKFSGEHPCRSVISLKLFYVANDGYEKQLYYRSPNMLAIFQTKFSICRGV